jgi:hypothetical protein
VKIIFNEIKVPEFQEVNVQFGMYNLENQFPKIITSYLTPKVL